MVEEIIRNIRTAEDEAEELVKKAQSEGRQIIADAGNRAETIRREAEKKAREEAQTLIKEAEAKGEEEAVPIREESEKEVAKLKEAATGNKEAAIAMITERIVKSDGNS